MKKKLTASTEKKKGNGRKKDATNKKATVATTPKKHNLKKTTTKSVIGLKLLQRDQRAITKKAEKVDKFLSASFSEINTFLEIAESRKDSAIKTKKLLIELVKSIRDLSASINEAQKNLKPIYDV